MKIVAESIDALVLFKGKEKPMPYRFKYIDSDGTRKEIRVDKILHTEETKLAGVRAYIYSCQSLIGNEEKRYELKYNVADCCWELYKI